MAYQEAIEAAGATVHVFKEFGSYQGDWWAKVTLASGLHGWISGSYGSCSGCDAFEAEFGAEEEKCDEHQWNIASPDACAECAEAKTAHLIKLAAFGGQYLDALMTQEDAIKDASKHLEWDSEATKVVEFLTYNAIKETE